MAAGRENQEESNVNQMARDIISKCKRCRRAGEKLFLKGDRCSTPKCAVVRKSYAPGMHGAKTRRSQSEFGQQLAMKQKMKRIYGVLERQFKKYFHEVKNKPGVTGDLLIQKLESRLDNVIYRAGFAANRRQARQLVLHAHFKINGKSVNIPSREVKPGDIIQLKPGRNSKEYFKNLEELLKGKKSEILPPWLEVDSRQMTVKFKAKPMREDLGINLDAQMIVEFYSR